jgi:3',5'-cyclic AMP phosphodiesterase CpdA
MDQQHSHFLVHITDTHLVRDGELLRGQVDTDLQLVKVLAQLEKADEKPEALVFSGDLADTGHPESYARLRELVDPVAERMGAQVIWCMGNHDDRAAFRAGLLGGEATAEPVNSVHDVHGLRIVVLDSTILGEHGGEIDDDQAAWLRSVLAEPAAHGTIVVLHHPPLPSPLEFLWPISLRGGEKLASAISGTDVLGILAGHLHYPTATAVAGVPVLAGGSVAYTQGLLASGGVARGLDGARTFNLVYVYANQLVNSVVPVDQYETLIVTPVAREDEVAAV